MIRQAQTVVDFVVGDAQAERSVPPTGFTARLSLFSAAAMAFLAVFAIALSLAAGKLAERWSSELARSSTLRITAPADQREEQAQAAMRILETTPGIARAHRLTAEEQQALLTPWFGEGFPVEQLPVPDLIEIIETDAGYDATGLRARLQAEVPGAFLDNHTQWREPLVRSAKGLRRLGWVSIAVIALATGAMVTLAAQSALAANKQVIEVLRLVGAEDAYIANAFVRRFTLRALGGAFIGMLLGAIAIILLPDADVTDGFLSGLGFHGWDWLWLISLPIFIGIVAYIATRHAARKTLEGLT